MNRKERREAQRKMRGVTVEFIEERPIHCGGCQTTFQPRPDDALGFDERDGQMWVVVECPGCGETVGGTFTGHVREIRRMRPGLERSRRVEAVYMNPAAQDPPHIASFPPALRPWLRHVHACPDCSRWNAQRPAAAPEQIAYLEAGPPCVRGAALWRDAHEWVAEHRQETDAALLASRARLKRLEAEQN